MASFYSNRVRTRVGGAKLGTGGRNAARCRPNLTRATQEGGGILRSGRRAHPYPTFILPAVENEGVERRIRIYADDFESWLEGLPRIRSSVRRDHSASNL